MMMPNSEAGSWSSGVAKVIDAPSGVETMSGVLLATLVDTNWYDETFAGAATKHRLSPHTHAVEQFDCSDQLDVGNDKRNYDTTTRTKQLRSILPVL